MLPARKRQNKRHRMPDSIDHGAIGDIPQGTGFQAREAKRLKRERIERLLSESRASLPPWHFLAPWEAERFLEPKQSPLWDGGQR